MYNSNKKAHLGDMTEKINPLLSTSHTNWILICWKTQVETRKGLQSLWYFQISLNLTLRMLVQNPTQLTYILVLETSANSINKCLYSAHVNVFPNTQGCTTCLICSYYIHLMFKIYFFQNKNLFFSWHWQMYNCIYSCSSFQVGIFSFSLLKSANLNSR